MPVDGGEAVVPGSRGSLPPRKPQAQVGEDVDTSERPDDDSIAPVADPVDQVDGLAVNLRIDDEDASLLYWLGFDVVETDATAFTDDLNHYARHVAEGPGNRPPRNARCEL